MRGNGKQSETTKYRRQEEPKPEITKRQPRPRHRRHDTHTTLHVVHCTVGERHCTFKSKLQFNVICISAFCISTQTAPHPSYKSDNSLSAALTLGTGHWNLIRTTGPLGSMTLPTVPSCNKIRAFENTNKLICELLRYSYSSR